MNDQTFYYRGASNEQEFVDGREPTDENVADAADAIIAYLATSGSPRARLVNAAPARNRTAWTITGSSPGEPTWEAEMARHEGMDDVRAPLHRPAMTMHRSGDATAARNMKRRPA